MRLLPVSGTGPPTHHPEPRPIGASQSNGASDPAVGDGTAAQPRRSPGLLGR